MVYLASSETGEARSQAWPRGLWAIGVVSFTRVLESGDDSILEAPGIFDIFGWDGCGAWFIFHELHNLIVMIVNVMSQKRLCFL